LLESRGVQAWVNCPMRMMPVYGRLREMFGEARVSYRLSGGDYGLATTLIHQLDFLMFLTGRDDFALDTSGLDRALAASKRPGYAELTGTVAARFGDGSRGVFTRCGQDGLPSLVTIESASERVLLDNLRGDLRRMDAETGEWSTEHFGIPLQSRLTTALADGLFSDGACALPPYGVSAGAHRVMMEALARFLREDVGYDKEDLPFT
jgi:hypothetical protein